MITEKGKLPSGIERIRNVMLYGAYDEHGKVHLLHREGYVEVEVEKWVGKAATYDGCLNMATEEVLEEINSLLNS